MQPDANTLDRLRDDKEYYGEFGRQFLSNSDVGSLLKNPKEFRVPREDNQAFAKGRYFHQSLLEPEKAVEFPFVDCASRNTMIYKNAIHEAGVPVLLLKKEKEELDQLVSTMRSNLWLYEHMYLSDNEFEVPGVQEFDGVWWKGKADIISSEYIIDLKTTSNLDDFIYSARKYNYDSQAYIYQSIFGKPLVFFAIEKSSGRMGVYYTSEDFIQRGKQKVERALEVYHKFFGPNAVEDIDQYFIIETL